MKGMELYCNVVESPSNVMAMSHRLAAEMLQFVEFLEPTEEEDEARAQLSDIICQHIKFCWPDSEVTVYGSCKTRLLLPTR